MKNERKKQDAHTETVCTKATDLQVRKVKRLAKQKKQTLSKTINDLLEIGLAQSVTGKEEASPLGE